MIHQWVFFGSNSAIRKIWSLTANSRSLQAAALNMLVWLFRPQKHEANLCFHLPNRFLRPYLFFQCVRFAFKINYQRLRVPSFPPKLVPGFFHRPTPEGARVFNLPTPPRLNGGSEGTMGKEHILFKRIL